MTNEFSIIMSQRTAAELLKIVNEQRNDFQSEAVDAAEAELQKRNLSSTQVQEAVHENEIKKQIESMKANLKLASGLKALTFIFPGIIQIIFAGTFKADGYDRKSKELVRWTLYGFGFYLGLTILFYLIR